jgi:hypothetical protein
MAPAGNQQNAPAVHFATRFAAISEPLPVRTTPFAGFANAQIAGLSSGLRSFSTTSPGSVLLEMTDNRMR